MTNSLCKLLNALNQSKRLAVVSLPVNTDNQKGNIWHGGLMVGY